MSDPLDALQRVITRRATEAEITAESGGVFEEIRMAWATDTDSLCIWTNGAWVCISSTTSGTSPTDANIWRPLLDGAGAVVTDGSGQAVMAWGPA